MNGLQFDSLFWIGVSPFDGSRRFIVLANIAHEFGSQVGERAKDAASNDVALYFREPVFNLVQPGGIGWREVNADIGVGLKEGIHQLCLMSREIVGNDMDLLADGLRGNNLFEEAHELRTGVALGSLAEDLPALSL